MIKKIKDFILLNIGLFLVAIGTYYFLVPNNLAAGGVSGLAMIIVKYVPNIPIGAFMLIMNVILLIIALIFIGRDFTARTIYSSVVLSGMIWLMEVVYPIHTPIVDDLLIQLLFSVVFCAVGMGIVFNSNGSTGGTDIIAKILNKYFKFPLGKGLLAADFLITLFAGLAFGPKIGMYALLGVFMNGFAIDFVIEGFNVLKQVVIITDKGELVKEFILSKMERGATLYEAKGAFTGEKKEIINVILNQKEFILLRNFIGGVDKDAFITVNTVHEVFGEGFKAY